MNESQTADLKDDILRILADLRQDDYRDISWFSTELWRTFDVCHVVVGELEDAGREGYVETRDHAIETFPDDKSVWITPEGRDFSDHNSFASQLEIERESQRAQAAESSTLKIIAIISVSMTVLLGLSTAYLGWSQHIDNKELKKVKVDNVKLQYQNDSLFNAVSAIGSQSEKPNKLNVPPQEIEKDIPK